MKAYETVRKQDGSSWSFPWCMWNGSQALTGGVYGRKQLLLGMQPDFHNA